MMLDLMLASETLREDVRAGRVACGINHTMRDHANHRRKDFDLVLHRPSVADAVAPATTFKRLLADYGVVFTEAQQSRVDDLPDVPTHPVRANAVYVAFEAKAAMTAFSKALPRLYDELNSSHLTIHGDTANSIAAALVMVNTASAFVSPVRNARAAGDDVVTTAHRQPADWLAVLHKVKELPRRVSPPAAGFDAVGVVPIECVNDGSPVRVGTDSQYRAQVSSTDFALLQNFDYGAMIERVAHLYEGLPHRR